MSYRNDLEAAQNRANALQKELDELKGTASAKKQNKHLAERPTDPIAVLESTVEGHLAPTTIEALVAHMRDEFGEYGQVNSLPNSVTWALTKAERTNPWLLMTIRFGEGKTTLRIQYLRKTMTPSATFPFVAVGVIATIIMVFDDVRWWFFLIPVGVVAALVSLERSVRRDDKREALDQVTHFDTVMNTLVNLSEAKRIP